MTTEQLVRDLWMVMLQDRRRLPVYDLSREDLCRMTRNGFDVRQELLEHMDIMPARLVERVATEAENW
jgi:hypothetical protein